MKDDNTERVSIRTKQVKRWANTLYFIAKEGLDYSNNNYDIKRYEEIKSISESLYLAWKRDKNIKMSSLTLKQLNYLIFRLSDITESGLSYAPSEYDANRYVDSTMILMDMEVVRDRYKVHQTKPKTILKKEEVEKKVQLTHFLKDEELPDAINELLNNTKKKLWICSPWIDDILDLKNQLVSLKEKKVEILVLTRKAKPNSSHHKALRKLKRERFLIETNPYLHTKLIISDDIKMYLGSANLVERSMTVLHEAGIITEDQHIIKPAIDYFNQLYDDAGDERITSL